MNCKTSCMAADIKKYHKDSKMMRATAETNTKNKNIKRNPQMIDVKFHCWDCWIRPRPTNKGFASSHALDGRAIPWDCCLECPWNERNSKLLFSSWLTFGDPFVLTVALFIQPRVQYMRPFLGTGIFTNRGKRTMYIEAQKAEQ